MNAAMKERVRARVRDIFAVELSDERARKLTELSDAFPQDAQVVEEIVKQESALALKAKPLTIEALQEEFPNMPPTTVAVLGERLRNHPKQIGSGYVDVVDIAKHEPPPTTKVMRYEDSVQYVVAKDYPALADAIKARADEGFKKYGTYLGVNNGRDVKMDMVQETLDAMNYGMQGMIEGRSGFVNPYKLAAIISMQLLGIAERVDEKKEHFYKLSEFQVETLVGDAPSPGAALLLYEGMRAWLERRRAGDGR